MYKGICQGNPISSYSFILAIELLVLNIKKNQHIKDIKNGNNNIKLFQYADDIITLFLADKDSIAAAFN